MDIAKFKGKPVLGIIRCRGAVAIEELVGAIISSGLEAIEIAMNSDDAASLISRAVAASRGRLMIGAGTVLDTKTLAEALHAGATFAVLPTLVEDVITACRREKIPVFAGALSPQEIYNAWNAGATMVKVFPAAVFGPAYIREIKAPFEDIELLACGGITTQNIKAYFENGASAVAFGGSIFKKEWLDARNFPKIEHAIRDLLVHAR